MDYIAHHARLHPSDVAIIENDTKITYAKFHQDLGRFLSAARDLNLEPGETVAIEWTSLYLHWLLVLSVETLGAVTFSYSKSEMLGFATLLSDADMIIGSEGAIPAGAVRVQHLTPQWIDRVFALEPDTDIRLPGLDPDAPTRLHCSSGTTGETKGMVRTARVNEVRIWQYQFKEGYDRHSRYMLSHPFSVQAVCGRATACIRMGGTCIHHPANIPAAISKHDATHVALLPIHLAKFLDNLPTGYTKPKHLTVSTFGAPVSERLRAQALQHLAAEVIESYGTNEVGTICTIRSDGIGIVFPGVCVEVVDEDDRPVLGKPGRLRVKGSGSIGSYEKAPNATARMFRDGWFYPGDDAEMISPGSLKLIGRSDELINIGGFKVDPARIEEPLGKIQAVKDYCVTTLADGAGNNQVCVALVLDPAAKLQDLVDAIRPKLPPILEKYVFIEITRVPRTSTGKAQRRKLSVLIADSRKSPATS